MSVIETSQDDKYTTDKLKKIKKEIEKKIVIIIKKY